MLKNNFYRFLLIALLVKVATPLSAAGTIDEVLSTYNVVWDTQSKNSTESMPVGGHSIGCNVWVEDGDLLFYAQRSGSFTENNEYHKLGRFRLKLSPNPFASGAEFKQELKLKEGYVEITGKSAEVEATINLWLEAERPVIHLDIESNVNTMAEVAYENWRTTTTPIATVPDHGAAFGCFSYDSYPGKIYKYADVIEPSDSSVMFYHRNNNDDLLIDFAIEQQNLTSVKDQIADTQTNRTFGGVMTGEGFKSAGTETGKYIKADYKAWKIASKEGKQAHSVKIYTHVDQSETIEIWKADLMALVNEEKVDATEMIATQAWWSNFWAKSWLTINTSNPTTNQTAWDMGRNYQLFRYMLGCNYYGDYPTKFNGGNFTFDAYPTLAPMKNFTPDNTPDWRAWGGGSFTGQNQRLLYWPMLKTGDFEGMTSQFDFYQRALSTAKARVQKYWGHDGCAFTEQMENFGLPIACAWGFESGGRTRTSGTPMGEQYNGAVKHQYEIQLEMSFMILEYNRYADVDISEYMEFIKQSVIFFDEHYRMRAKKSSGKELDDDGKLIIYPSTACESHKMATNPIDVVAGIKACSMGLIELPTSLVSETEKAYYQEVINSLPAYYTAEKNGDTYWKAAQKWGSRVNDMELPEFYPLFPYNLHNLEDSVDMQTFRNTYKHGDFRKNSYVSWHQDGIFLARMGMVTEAQNINTNKLRNGPFRFPSFWGPGHDWVPDHNWGGSGMIGIQEMLMQTTGDKIMLFPAWPKNWDVDFKFHAPNQTVVECTLKNGEVTNLKVTPESRLKDVV